MQIMIIRSSIIAAFCAAFALAGCGQGKKEETSSTPAETTAPASGSLVDTAKGIGIFSTFVRVVGASSMAGTLTGPGPYTIFVPADDAFAKMPPAEVEKLVTDQAAADAFLKRYIVNDKVEYANIPGGKSTLSTIDGATLYMEISDAVYADGVKVIQMNIAAPNGVLHVLGAPLPASYTPK
jgi:uncharacterized surface protein with fasciclin (FAS1) repeats